MATKDFNLVTRLTLDMAGFKKGVDDTKKTANALASGVKEAGNSMKSVFANAGEMFAPMTGQLGGLKDGILGGVKSFKAMVPAITGVKTAFMATGIGAIVIALAAAFAGLVAWIKRTDQGSDAMRKVFDIIKAVINTILDKLAALGSAIFKLFKGDFKGAGEDAKRALTGWGDAISDNVKKAKELNEIQDQLEDFNETAALKRAEIEERISQLALKARDVENYNADQRLSFVKQLRAEYANLYNLNNQGHQIELAQLKKEQSTNADNQDLRQKVNEKLAEGVRLSAEHNNNLTATSKLYNKTRGEIAANVKEQEKLNAEFAKQKADDVKGLKKMDQVKVQGPGNNLVKELTERQNAYNNSLFQTTNHWREMGKEVKNFMTSAEGINGVLGGVSDAFKDLFTSGKNGFKAFAKAMLDSTFSVIQGYLAQAIAAQIASNSKAGLPGLIMAGVGIAAVKGMFASMMKFENGGIVPGMSYAGDNVHAMVNSGEMILNGSQQSNLFRMLNGGGGSMGGGRLTTKVTGRELLIILENERNFMSRGR
jgi:hypothetical protein